MRLSDVVFLVGHHSFKTVDVGVFALCQASRCLFEYVNVSETPFIKMFFFLITRFKFYVSLMYWMFH